MKKYLAILLALVLCISMLAACTPQPTEPAGTTPKPTEPQPTEPQPTEPQPTEPADPIEALPGSIYYYGYAVEGIGNMIQFYHFYPDDLGIGAVFYAGYAWNQIYFSGTYTVAEEPIEYTVSVDRDGNTETGTAPYTITLYGWDGAELDKIGYDGEHVYNIAVNVNSDPMAGGGVVKQDKATAEVIEANPDTFAGEKGIPYMNFVNPEDASATLQLNTNGTYSDLVFFAVDGKWAKTAEGEYTLTPADPTNDGAVVKLQEDGSYKYTSTSGSEVVLQEVKEAAVSFTFAGKTPFMDAEADVTVTCLDDGTCVVTIAAFGMEMPIDKGTWSADAAFTFTFQFESAGQIVSEYGGETGVQVTYANENTVSTIGAAVNAVCGVVLG
jgi:hypothetical protein